MTQSTTQINCPECGHEIDVNEILYHQLQEEIEKKYSSKFNKQQKQLSERAEELRKEKEKIDKQKIDLEEQIEKGIKTKLNAEKLKIEKKLREQISEEKSEEIKAYQTQLETKIQETKELNKLKAEFAKLQRDKEDLREKIEAETQIKLNKELGEAKEKMKKELESKVELKLSEKDILIENLNQKLIEAQKKIEQGSGQIQGEAQELAIEKWLKDNFPIDSIQEIKKGLRGADCLHVVNNMQMTPCGSVYYESKRTKDFQSSWIEKFKTDMREKGATFGVLVTDALPKGMERLTQKDGIWVCTYDEFKGLCFVLRESVLLLSNALISQENKDGKMSQLYDYLTGNEFRMRVEAIVEGFSIMHTDLARERRAMESIWKQREKQIQKVIQNTNLMYSSIKGIAGNAIGTIAALEPPAPSELPDIE